MIVTKSRDILWLAALYFIFYAVTCQAAVVVICHPDLPTLDKTELFRIYTGRMVRIDDTAVYPVNLKHGAPARSAFFEKVLGKSDDDYVSYWIVRRAIGKGVPPPELDDPEQVLDFVRETPGAVGYLEKTGSDLSGVNIVLTTDD